MESTLDDMTQSVAKSDRLAWSNICVVLVVIVCTVPLLGERNAAAFRFKLLNVVNTMPSTECME